MNVEGIVLLVFKKGFKWDGFDFFLSWIVIDNDFCMWMGVICDNFIYVMVVFFCNIGF